MDLRFVRHRAETSAGRLPLGEDNPLYRAPSAPIDLPADDADDVMAAYLGSRNAGYYLRVFRKFETGGGILSWNWPAFFITSAWFLYRRLWIWFFVSWLGLPLVAFTAGAISSTLHPIFGLGVFVFVYFCLAPIFANYIFYHRAIVHVAAAKATSPRLETQVSAAERMGGTNAMGAWIFCIIVYSLSTANILFSVSTLTKQAGIKTRPVPMEVTENFEANLQSEAAVNATIEARQLVELYYMDHSRYPLDDTEAGFEYRGPYPNVKAIYILEGRVVIEFDATASPELRNESIFMIPSYNGAGFSWSCGSPSIDRAYLPTRCRL